MALVPALFLLMSKVTLNNLLKESLDTFQSTSKDYYLQNQFFSVDTLNSKYSLSFLLRNIYVNYINISAYDLTLNPINEIKINITNINSLFSFDWEYSLGSMTDHGKSSVNITSMSILLSVIMRPINILATSSGNTKVSIKDLKLVLQKPSGVNSAWVFKMFKDDFRRLLEDYIESSLDSAINSFDLSPMFYEISNSDIAFNYSLARPPLISTEELEIQSIGIFVSKLEPNYSPSIPVPTRPSFGSGLGVHAVLTDYSANSLSFTAYSQGLLDLNITNSELPPNFPLPLTTTTVGLLIPGLVTKYGLDEPMSFYCKFQQAPLIRFIDNKNWSAEGKADGNLGCDVFVEDELAIVLNISAVADLKFYLENWMIRGNITQAKVTEVKVVKSTFPLNPSRLKDLINTQLSLYTESINNAYLNQGIELPASSRFNLTDTLLRTGDGYLYVKANPKITLSLSDFIN